MAVTLVADALEAHLALVGRLDEPGKQRMRAERLGLELGMKLDGQVPGMAGELDDLDELPIERPADNLEAAIEERLLILAVELVAMAMALVDDLLAVEAPGQGVGRQPAGVAAKAHRPTEVVDPEQVPQLVDDLVGGILGDLGRIGPFDAGDVAGEFDDGPLEPIANPEVRDPVGAGIFGGGDHAAAAAIAKPGGHQDTDGRGQPRQALLGFERLGFDILEPDFEPVLEPAVVQGFVDALVGVLVLDVLADEVDRRPRRADS